MSRVAALWDEWAVEDDFGDPLGPTTGTTSLGSVTFPTSPLVARVYIALGADLSSAQWWQWNWLDITSRVRVDQGITIEAGRRDQFAIVTPSRCTIKVDNNDGYLSRRRAVSPYYGQLTKNTPIWIQLNPGSGFVDRFQGFVNEWPNRWSDLSGTDATVTIECSGVLRRLGQGGSDQTPLNRTILADGPVHFWRIDDPTGSTSAASSLTGGGQSLTQFGTVDWRYLASPPGGDGATSAARFRNGYLYHESLNVGAPWTLEWSLLRPQDGTLDGTNVMQISFLVNGVEQSQAFGTGLDTNVSARTWYHYMITGTQNGANYEIHRWRNGVDVGVVATGAGTLGALTRAYAFGGWLVTATDNGVGYVAAYNKVGLSAANHSVSLQAGIGEMAHARVTRLCGEAKVPVVALAATSTVMGAQPTGKLLDLLRECEAADQGVLCESQFGLGYKANSELSNQPVSLSLDFNQGHISGLPEPSDDDQFTRNKWTSTRSGGVASYTAEQTTGTMGTGPGGAGDWPGGGTVNVQTDGQLAHDASWHVHTGTVDEDRWPALPLMMHGSPGLIPSWLAMPLEGRLNLAHPPAQMAQDTIDALLDGYTEHFDEQSWYVTLNTSPASPYNVATLEDPVLGRPESGTSTLTADIGSADASISVTTTNVTDLWTTSAADFPFDVVIGGEVMTVTNITGASSPQTFTITRSVNGVVKSHRANNGVLSEVHLRYPMTLAL